LEDLKLLALLLRDSLKLRFSCLLLFEVEFQKFFEFGKTLDEPLGMGRCGLSVRDLTLIFVVNKLTSDTISTVAKLMEVIAELCLVASW